MESPLNVEVGKYYNIPSGITASGEIIPILFPDHIDKKEDCINEIPRHYHIDHRFINNIYDAQTKNDLKDIKYRNLKCITTKSQWKQPWPFAIEKLHRNYENYLVKNKGNRCPHQGVRIINKCGTCPAHGLRWSFKTGELYYKLPFFLEVENTKDHGMIKNGFCEVLISESKVVTRLVLKDSLGKYYPNCYYDLPTPLHAFSNSIISIKDKNCGLNNENNKRRV